MLFILELLSKCLGNSLNPFFCKKSFSSPQIAAWSTETPGLPVPGMTDSTYPEVVLSYLKLNKVICIKC